MDLDRPTPLLGGLSAAAFMRRHWQKKPLLVRGALADPMPAFDERRLFELAARSDVESRLVVREAGGRWTRRSGPLPRRALPALATPGWSLLAQGVDLHDDAAHRLLGRFRFVADARLDDVMVSFASDGGGVGPHIDSYDVFLVQLAGRRRWRVGPVAQPRLRSDVPLKMLADFVPRDDWLLEPGDLLYVPPGWGHDGIAEGSCLTASIGFRAPDAETLGIELLERIADACRDQRDDAEDDDDRPAERLYRDPAGTVTHQPARVPAALQQFAHTAVDRLLADRSVRARALGEALSEPKPGTSFTASAGLEPAGRLVLDRRTRMLYDERHVFINGESFRAGGRDATLMRRLADRRGLDARAVSSLSAEAVALLDGWAAAGWCRSVLGAQSAERE